MSQQIIDLTLRIENNMLAPDCFPRPVYIKAMTHEKSIEMHNGTPEDPITSSYNYLSIVEHVGTHVDSCARTEQPSTKCRSPSFSEKPFVWICAAFRSAEKLP